MRTDPNALMKKFKALEGDAAQTAEAMDVHISTIYRWKRRARLPYGKNKFRHTGLKRRSTKPHNIRSPVLTRDDREQIEIMRLNTGWDVAKIRHALNLRASESSVYRFLLKKGLIEVNGNHRRPLGQPTIHMHAKNVSTVGKLQMDVKYVTPALSGLPHTCFEYAVIDIFSRYKQGIIVPNLDAWSSIASLRVILPMLPFKVDFIQTDNGLEFQSVFMDFLKQQGISHHFIHKSTPNENAVIERSFRTDEEEFYFAPKYRRPIDLHDLNNQFHAYLKFYNDERPHFGINLETPSAFLANVLKD